jgi:hypothetical protein
VLAMAFVIVSLWSPPLLLAGTSLAIPKPTDVLLPPPPPPTLEPSVVNLTIGRTFREMRDAVESSIPVHHRHEEEWISAKRRLNGTPFEYQYYVWRGPVNFKVDGDQLVTEFPDVRYRVRVRLKEPNGDIRTAECGYGADAHMRMRLAATSDVRWDEHWLLHTNTQFGRPQFGEPCRLSPIDVDVTDLLNEWLEERLPLLASAIDQTFRHHVEAKKRAQIIWGTFQEPTELGPDTWLAYHPKNPRAGSLTLDRERFVRTTISMAFDPIIAVGPKPHFDKSPLPSLQTGPIAQEGFHLTVPMVVPFEELNKRLASEVVGEELIPPVGSPIRITGVRIYGSGASLICEVSVTGGVNGLLYLQGKPALTPDGRTLELRDFNFTVDTSNVLVKFTNRIMYNSIREKILPYTKLEVGDRIETLRSRVQRQMNRELAPGIWLEGAVTKLAPRGIYPVPGGIEVQFVMDGTLNLSIQ